MTDKFLPCPFCGDRMEIRGTIIRHRINTDCAISFQAWDESAIDSWNRRDPAPQPREMGISPTTPPQGKEE
jgi:hypothetical protein